MNRAYLLGALAVLAWTHGLGSALLFRAGEAEIGWFLLVSAGVLAFLTVPAFAAFIPSVDEVMLRSDIAKLKAQLDKKQDAPARRTEKPS